MSDHPSWAVLKNFMSAAARESNLAVGRTGPQWQALRRALEADPELAQAARALIQDRSTVTDRDHVARWQVDALNRALGGA